MDPDAFAEARAAQVALLHSYERESRAAIFGRNVDFHEMLTRCANNDFFLEAVRRTNSMRRIEYRITTDRARLPRQCCEHLQILDMIEEGDMQAAADFLFRHIREAGHLMAAQLG